MKRTTVGLALCLVVASCAATPASLEAEDGASARPLPDASAVSEAPSDSGSTGSGSTVTSTAPDTTKAYIVPDGPPAPNFSLALANGGTYELAAATKPTYLVFWAEW